jgi:hypothetical protein
MSVWQLRAKSCPSLTIIIYVRNIFGLATKEAGHPSMMETSRATTSAVPPTADIVAAMSENQYKRRHAGDPHVTSARTNPLKLLDRKSGAEFLILCTRFRAEIGDLVSFGVIDSAWIQRSFVMNWNYGGLLVDRQRLGALIVHLGLGLTALAVVQSRACF